MVRRRSRGIAEALAGRGATRSFSMKPGCDRLCPKRSPAQDDAASIRSGIDMPRPPGRRNCPAMPTVNWWVQDVAASLPVRLIDASRPAHGCSTCVRCTRRQDGTALRHAGYDSDGPRQRCRAARTAEGQSRPAGICQPRSSCADADGTRSNSRRSMPFSSMRPARPLVRSGVIRRFSSTVRRPMSPAGWRIAAQDILANAVHAAQTRRHAGVCDLLA